MPEPRNFTKEEIEELRSHVPIEIVGELNVMEKKAKMFDLLSRSQAEWFLAFKQEAIMGSDKLEVAMADATDIMMAWKGLYAIVPISGEVVLNLILQVI